MNFTPAAFTLNQIAAQCRSFGPTVGPLPPGVDGTQLLWAIAGVESTFGKNTTPRHEPAFDIGGVYATHAPMPFLLAKYGRLGASSFGPLQILLCNAPSCAPADFNDLPTAFHESVIFLNSLLRRFLPKSLAEIGQCWNHGSIGPDPVYVDRLRNTYKMPMPTALDAMSA